MQLPATPSEALRGCVIPGLALLPLKMNTIEAQVMLLSIAQQESALRHRFQVVQGKPGAKGPARGIFQMERGTQASRGGIFGVYLHFASSGHLKNICTERGIDFSVPAIYAAVEVDDIFATAVARLLLWTDAQPLPRVNDVSAAWDTYIRTWRPGKPHPAKWKSYHLAAQAAVDRRA